MDTVLLKFIFFFVIILFTNHSIAQEVPPFRFVPHVEVKDTTKQSSTTIATFGGDNVQEAKDTTKSKVKSDTAKAAVKLVNKIAEHTAAPIKQATKQVDTIYLLEVVKPQITQSTITFDAGQVFSTFKFIDNQGNIKKFSNNITHIQENYNERSKTIRKAG